MGQAFGQRLLLRELFLVFALGALAVGTLLFVLFTLTFGVSISFCGDKRPPSCR
jgi:hypothetical protein